MEVRRDHHITKDHYAAFGMIVNVYADLEVLLDAIIIEMTKGEPHHVLPLLSMLSGKDKRDFIVAHVKESNLPPYARDGLEKLMKRIQKASDLRNKIAHCGWVAGGKAGTIKPLTLSARSTIKIVGLDRNEKEWTATDLTKEVIKFQQIGRDIIDFMKPYGLAPDMEALGKKAGRKPKMTF